MGGTVSSQPAESRFNMENNDPHCVLRSTVSSFSEDPLQTVSENLVFSNLASSDDLTHLTSFALEDGNVFFSDVTFTFTNVNEAMSGYQLRFGILDENGSFVTWCMTPVTNSEVTLFTIAKDGIGFYARGDGVRRVHVLLHGPNVSTIKNLGIHVQYNIYSKENVTWNNSFSTQKSFSYVSPSDGSKDITAMFQGNIWNMHVSSNGVQCLYSLDIDDHGAHPFDDSENSEDSDSENKAINNGIRHYNDFQTLLASYDVPSYHIDEFDETVYLCTDPNVPIDVLVTRKIELLV